MSTLQTACRNCNRPSDAINEKDARKLTANQCSQCVDRDGEGIHVSYSECYSMLKNAILAEDECRICKALKCGVDINTVEIEGLPAIFWASKQSLVLMKLLIENGANYNVLNVEKQNILFYAVSGKKCDRANYIINMGLDINARDRYSATPLDWAMRYENTECVKLLIDKGAAVDSLDKDGMSTLAAAVGASEVRYGAEHKNATIFIMKILINNGVDVNIANSDGETAMHYAAEKRDLDILRILLENDADINAATKNNRTPLDYALCTRDEDQLEMCEINSDGNWDSSDSPALDSKEKEALRATIEYLKSNGAKHGKDLSE